MNECDIKCHNNSIKYGCLAVGNNLELCGKRTIANNSKYKYSHNVIDKIEKYKNKE